MKTRPKPRPPVDVAPLVTDSRQRRRWKERKIAKYVARGDRIAAADAELEAHRAARAALSRAIL